MKQQVDVEVVVEQARAVAEAASALAQKVTELLECLATVTVDSKNRDLLHNLLGSQLQAPEVIYGEIIISQAARTVTYRGRTCSLGNTLAFPMMERLARRPNEYVPFSRLIREVWDGHPRSEDAIRSMAKELRGRLEKSGMHSLAAAIHGERKAYKLNLNTAATAHTRRS